MIELKNSKTQYLGEASGGGRYALDACIGAVQMREPEGLWQDIRPCLVRDADGWHVEGAPYYAEIKDDGSRLFCPDRNERSKYIRFLPHARLKGQGALRTNLARLGNEYIANELQFAADFGEFSFLFTNTGMYLPIKLAAPIEVSGQAIDRLTFDIDTNLDIEGLLRAESGPGIIPGRITDARGGSGALEWSFKNGQLELGFDLAGLQFPVLLEDAVDVQVGASANDGHVYPSSGFDNTNSTIECGRDSTLLVEAFHRWTGVTVPQSSTIDVCYVQLYETSTVGSPLTNLYFEKANDPAAVTSYANYCSRTLTTAYVAWDGDPGSEGWYSSPSLVSPMQELVNAYGLNNQAVQLFHKDDGSSTNNYRKNLSWDYSGNIYGARLHIEFTAGGGATAKTAAETGAGAEGSLTAAAVLTAETGSGADVKGEYPAAVLTGPESAAGIEARADYPAAVMTGLDPGTGDEAKSDYPPAQLTGPETAAGIEAKADDPFGVLISIEGGSGTDVSWLLAAIAGVIETGSGAELAECGMDVTVLSVSDSGGGIEAAVSRWLESRETGSGLDTAVMAVVFRSLVAGETGLGGELAAVMAALNRGESGSGSEISSFILLVSDSALGSELRILLKAVLSGDGGRGRDALKTMKGAAGKSADVEISGRGRQAGKPSRQVNIPSKGVNL